MARFETQRFDFKCCLSHFDALPSLCCFVAARHVFTSARLSKMYGETASGIYVSDVLAISDYRKYDACEICLSRKNPAPHNKSEA